MAYTGPHPQLDHIVLSDTFNEWRTKTNKHVDVLNFVKVYDLVAGDGITFSKTGGDYTLEVAGEITKGVTFSGDVTFNGDVTTINTTTVTVDDKRIDLGASGASDAAGGDDSIMDGGGIALLSTDGNKTWTFSNSISGQKAWTSSEHIGITNGRALVSNDNVIRFRDSKHDELHFGFTADVQGTEIINISFAAGSTIGGVGLGTTYGATAAMSGTAAFGNGVGTGGIRIRKDGYTEIFNGVNRIFVEQAGHGFVHGDIVRHTGSGYTGALGDSEINGEAFGIVDRSSHSDANSFVVVTHGSVRGFGDIDSSGSLSTGEVYFLSTTDQGKSTTTRPLAKTKIVKPMYIALSTTEAHVFNYIGGIVPDADIIQNSVPEVWKFTATDGQTAFGLGVTSGNASSTKSQTYLVTVFSKNNLGVVTSDQKQIPENASPSGAGTGLTFGTAGGTGPADFRITSAADGVTLEFVEGISGGNDILVMNQALTTPVEAIDETVLRPDGVIEHRLLKNILGDMVSVKDFGAVGSGAVDETTVIQSAIDQTDPSATNNKRKIFFPAGTYVVSSPLVISNNSVELYGEGISGGSTIRFEGTTGPMIKGPNSPARYTDFRIRDIRLQMNSDEGETGGVCVDLTNLDKTTFENVQFDGVTAGATAPSNSVGLKINGNDSHRILGCVFANNQTAVEITSEDTNKTQNVLIEGNRIAGAENVDDLGVAGDPETFGVKVVGGTTGAFGVSVLNNQIQDCDFPISIDGNNENVNISQNTFFSGHVGVTSACANGITADGNTKNMVLMGNTGAANTGAAFSLNTTFQNTITMNDGAVSAVNLPKANVLFAHTTGSATQIFGGTGPGRTGSSFNIHHVERNSVGEYTIHFDTPLQTNNYCIFGTAGATAAYVGISDRSSHMTTTSCRVFVKHPGQPGQSTSDRLVDPDVVSVTVI